jgi:peptide/nickel transport system substrate-binding protein
MRRFKVLVVMLICCFFSAACQADLYPKSISKNDAGFETGIYEEDYDIMDKGPVYGETLNLFTTAPDTLNPVLTKNKYVADVLGFIYEGMTRLDGNQQAIPVLADSWTVSSNGLIWDFHIRDGVMWHDGEPFTAYDVEFTINTIMNPGMETVYKPLVYNISTCTAIDSYNIRFALKKPNSFTAEMMTFPIIPRHQFIQMDILSDSQQFEPVGTGPYRFESYSENKNILLSLNNDWWQLKAEDDKMHDGMYIGAIKANIIKKPDDAMGLFQTGEVDAAGIEAVDLSKYTGRTDLIIKKYTSRDFEFLAFNLKNPVFADQYARKAINMAIDRYGLISEVLPGLAEAAELPILPESWISEADADNSAKQTGQADEVSGEGGIAAADAKTPGEMLALGGWKESAQGYYKVIDGARRYLKAELIVNSNNSLRLRAASKVCEQLKNAGIPVELKSVDWNELMNRLASSKFDIAFVGCRIPQIPDISFLYSDGYLPMPLAGFDETAYNISGYYNPEADADIEALFKEHGLEQRKTIFAKLKKRVLDDVPYIGLYFLRDAMVYGKNIRGLIDPDTWNRYNDMDNWYKPGTP